MEALLRELIDINKQMLIEIRQLRQDIAGGQAAPFAPAPQAAQPVFEQGLGIGEPAKAPPPRYSPEDLEDIRGSLIEGIKSRNKDKRNAFSEFEKRHKDW